MDDLNLTPFRKTVVGVQFLFVAFGSTVLVPLLVGLDPATALFSAGIGTLIFHLVTKGIVPIFLGSSFAFISPIILASAEWGLSGTLTAFAGVSLIYFLMAGLVKWKGMQLLDKLFPPVVIGPVIMLIGLSLSGTAVDMAKTDWLLALVALVVSIIVMIFGKGLLKLLPVISGIIAGFVVAICLGKVDFTAVSDASWFALPQNIRHPQLPSFSLEPFVFMMPIALGVMCMLSVLWQTRILLRTQACIVPCWAMAWLAWQLL